MPDKLRLPIPDPLGIIESITEGAPVQLFDPITSQESSKDISPELSGDQVEMYTYHLEQALRHAPCPGCRKMVMGGLTTAQIYQHMEDTGLSAKDIDDAEIEKIKRNVKEKYG